MTPYVAFGTAANLSLLLLLAVMTYNLAHYCRVNSLAGFTQNGAYKNHCVTGSSYNLYHASMHNQCIIIMWYALYTDFNS